MSVIVHPTIPSLKRAKTNALRSFFSSPTPQASRLLARASSKSFKKRTTHNLRHATNLFTNKYVLPLHHSNKDVNDSCRGR